MKFQVDILWSLPVPCSNLRGFTSVDCSFSNQNSVVQITNQFFFSTSVPYIDVISFTRTSGIIFGRTKLMNVSRFSHLYRASRRRHGEVLIGLLWPSGPHKVHLLQQVGNRLEPRLIVGSQCVEAILQPLGVMLVEQQLLLTFTGR